MKKIFTMFCLAMTLFSAPVHAHYPWINVTDYTPETGSSLKMTIGWGHSYPLAGFLKKDALENIDITGPGKTKTELIFVSDLEIESKNSITEPGVYIVAATRKESFYTKTTQGGKSSSKKNLQNVIKCSLSHMCMKAIVNIGEGEGKVDTRVGHPMEIIPLENPGNIRTGDYMSLQVLYNEKPFNGYIFATFAGFSTEKETFAYATKTNKKGIAKVRISQPGVWLIKASHEQAYPDLTECDVESFIATLTFEVR